MSKSTQPDSPSRVLSASYIERHSNKNDLVRRLRTVVDALGDDNIEPNSPDYPGLASLAAALVGDRFLKHRDKEVRLHTVLACMEIFYLYAPDPPWYEAEILQVFSQMIRQLANLAHCTSPSQANFKHYFRILEQLSVVKIGVILVELTKTLDSERLGGSKRDAPSSEDALEMLADLIRTILRSVHIDHPPEVANHAVSAVSACIDEFDGTVPIPALDEILTCVGEGPIVYVTNPAAVEAAARVAKKKEKPEKMPPMQIQQTNPSYHVASSVIRRTVDRISTPMAGLLNGLLNGDPNVISQTVITSAENSSGGTSSAFPVAPEKQASADVWTIVYELHRISPQILTTVIGTVTNSLESTDLELRLRVTKLLGRLFYAPKSKIGVEFNVCFRKWIRRSTDAEPKVRLAMVKYLVTVLSNKGQESLLVDEASEAIVKMIEEDPNLDVRREAIHKVCDLAYKAKPPSSHLPASGENTTTDSQVSVSPRLLRAVGSRVSSKSKTERRDAVTGLAQIYFRHYVEEKLKQVQSGGDDCDIGIILDTLHDTGCGEWAQGTGRHSKTKRQSLGDDDAVGGLPDLDEKYGWIPRIVFESACFTDATDPEMRNRVIQLVDDVLLSSGASNSEGDSDKKGSLTATSRAVGLAFIVNSLRDESEDHRAATSNNANMWMCKLFQQRSSLQRAVGRYIDSRSKLKRCEPDTEEALTAEAEAMACLEGVAKLTAPVSSSGTGVSAHDTQTIIKKLHSARDKHIFRILATIASPTHSASARARALDELPKRTKNLGTATADWVKTLARRCAMGNFVNIENIHDCVLLAQESFHEQDIHGCMSFLLCVKLASRFFPALCGERETFGTLVELFGECRAESSGNTKKEIENSGLVTVLSAILAAAAPARAARFVGEKDKEKSPTLIDRDLETQLLKLCTRDGTPEQARSAVYTMAALQRSAGSGSDGDMDINTFGPLLKALTSPTRMSLTTGSSGNDDVKVISILTALAALADCAPSLFSDTNPRGEKAIRFALETVLLGRSDIVEQIESDEDDVASDDEEELATPSSKSRRRKSKGRSSEGVTKHTTPGDNVDVLQDAALSVSCRRACAAIEFIVSYIRSTVMKAGDAQPIPNAREADKENQQRNKSQSTESDHSRKHDGTISAVRASSSQHIQHIFSLLSQILRDKGLPPSSRDRRHCRSRQDRAALRQCAAVHLLRLCEGRLKLERHLTHSMWHILSSAFLDEERTVRGAVMDQLSAMLQGLFAPSLRLVAFTTLCVDGEHGSGHAGANGNAANVGKRAASAKDAALRCITALRKTYDATLAHCRARGREAEKNFENDFKMRLMPEFAVPYAFHLLSFRRETPSAGGSAVVGLSQPSSTQNEDEDEITVDEEGRYKVLKKRLKWLFEPLVQSLGDGADNISFLLRITEMLGNNYRPRDVSRELDSGSPRMNDMESPQSLTRSFSPVGSKSSHAAAKLKVICGAAREVLLSFVKKDINLTPYPGAVQLPLQLFCPLTSAPRLSQSSDSSQQVSLGSRPTSSKLSSSSVKTTRPVHDSPYDASISPGRSKEGKMSARATRRSVRSLRERSSIDSASHGSASGDRERPSLDSTKSSIVGSEHARESIDSSSFLSGKNKRKLSVQFSPDVHGGSDFFVDDDYEGNTASSPVRRNTQEAFGELSPIHALGTPSPNQRLGTQLSASSSTERLTLGATPPSILRSRDGGPTPTSLKSEDEAPRRRRRHPRRARRASSPEQKENVSANLISTPARDEEFQSPVSSEKRKSPGDSSERSSTKRRKKGGAVQVKTGRSGAAMEKPLTKAQRGESRRSGRRKSTPDNSPDNDEFDFPDDFDNSDEEWEHSERGTRKTKNRASTKAAASPKRTSRTTARNVVRKSPKEVSLGSNSSPDSESSSITSLKRRAGARGKARKTSVSVPRRSRRNRG